MTLYRPPVPEHIFRAYDIRGDANTCLTAAVVEAIGRAIASEALAKGEHSLLVGHDSRTHSLKLRDHLQRGIVSTGCHVITVGLVPTPLLNFATIVSDATGSGVMITASHNPKSDNGFKVVLNQKTLTERDIQCLKKRVSDGSFTSAETSKGSSTTACFRQQYLDTIAADITLGRSFRIVVDAANGAASELAPQVFKKLGCAVETLFCKFDGEFPNHEPDPGVESNLQALIETVKKTGADMGLALDGDGDRLVVVTSSGRVIWPDQLLMIFAKETISRHPGCDVIYDVKCTRYLAQAISRYGGHPVMWKTGHSSIKTKMHTSGAPLGGEYSGHIFFKERWFGFDDGIYAAARLLEIMSLRDQSLDDMLDDLPKAVATGEIRIPVTEASKFRIIQQLIDTGDFPSGKKITIDGLRVDFPTGWGLARASNTSAALTLRFEADNETAIGVLKTLFQRELHKIDPLLPLDF